MLENAKVNALVALSFFHLQNCTQWCLKILCCSILAIVDMPVHPLVVICTLLLTLYLLVDCLNSVSKLLSISVFKFHCSLTDFKQSICLPIFSDAKALFERFSKQLMVTFKMECHSPSYRDTSMNALSKMFSCSLICMHLFR